jgi:hypothetical protein
MTTQWNKERINTAGYQQAAVFAQVDLRILHQFFATF